MTTMIRLDFPVLFNFVEPVPYRVFIIPDAYTFVKSKIRNFLALASHSFHYDGILKEPCIESPAFGQTLIRGLGTTG